ncbi:MAG: methionyl-tRNA formyltransferase [bacterium]|nr:methionyl-tRNA formyltransferase [bacterium]
MKNDLKIIFFGTPDFAVPVLKELLKNSYSVVGVFANNGQVEIEAKNQGIKVFKPDSLKKDEVFEQFKSLNPDLCVIAAYGKIIPSRYLDIPKHGFLNVHPSVLPKYRGPSPVQTAILNGDTETGASIMIVDQEIDHGPILASVKYKIPLIKYHNEIAGEIFRLGGKLLVETLPKYINKEIKSHEQDHSQATFTKMFTRDDSKIDWNKTAEEIFNKIRALNPEPGTWTKWNGKVLNIKEAQPLYLEVEPLSTGLVQKIHNNIAVVTKKCYLILKQVQLEGGKEMDAKAFLNGHPDFLGSRLE